MEFSGFYRAPGLTAPGASWDLQPLKRLESGVRGLDLKPQALTPIQRTPSSNDRPIEKTWKLL